VLNIENKFPLTKMSEQKFCQVKHRWKTLKSIYYKAKKQNPSNSNSAFKHFDTMEEIFGHRPLVVVTNQTGDIDFKDGSPLSDSKCFTFEDGEDDDDDDDGDGDDGEWTCMLQSKKKLKEKVPGWYHVLVCFTTRAFTKHIFSWIS